MLGPVRSVAPAPVDVDELTSRGGSPGGKAEVAGVTTPVVLRIPAAMLGQIDALVKAQ